MIARRFNPRSIAIRASILRADCEVSSSVDVCSARRSRSSRHCSRAAEAAVRTERSVGSVIGVVDGIFCVEVIVVGGVGVGVGV